MFIELLPLLEKNALVIIVSKLNSGSLRAVITQKGEDVKKSLPSLCVEGTAELLDQELPSALRKFSGKSLSLHDSIQTLDTQIQAIEDEKKKELEAARKSGKTPLKGSIAKPEPTTDESKVKGKTNGPQEGTLDLGLSEVETAKT